MARPPASAARTSPIGWIGHSPLVIAGLVPLACGRLAYAPRAGTADAEVDADLAPDASANDGGTGWLRPCQSLRPGDLLCHDFDEAVPAATRTRASATLDTTRRHAGAASLRIATMPDGSAIPLYGHDLGIVPVASSGEFHIRAHYYLPSGFQITGWGVLMELKRNSAKISIDVSGGANLSIQAPGNPQLTAVPAPRDRWFCLALDVVLDSSAGSATVRLDGEPVLGTAAPFDSTLGGGIDFARAGLVTSPDETVLDLYMDELLVSSEPVDCL
jgi:hypothetical protein